MNIIICGSLAYDRIMDFPGYFADHILPEKIHVLNVSFMVNSLVEKFGGTAGNIAYALTLLGERPLISAAIGQDYQRYFAWLKKNAISTDSIKIIENDFTASAYITTDKANNQITGFHPGAMNYSSSLDFDQLDPKDTLVIVSPGNLQDMCNYPQLCKARGIDYIFDPGQSLPMLEAKDLEQSIQGSRITICNDYELDLILAKTGLTKNALFKMTRTLIITQGERGSLVCTAEGEEQIPVVQARKVLDPTGAGDSYRGGLVSGLMQGLPILRCARMGSACASFCVEQYGTQEYSFTPQEFKTRLSSCL